MITAGTLVATIAEMVVSKAAAGLASLALDKRRKACRALTKLYFCVSALDEATGEVLRDFDDFQSSDLESSGTAFALINALNNHMHEISHATDTFVDLGYELEAGLTILDPALAATCNVLYRGKYDFLMFMADAVEWDRSQDRQRIRIKSPTAKANNVELDSLYEQSVVELGRGEKVYWPATSLGDFNELYEEVVIEWEDDTTARKVYDMLTRQKIALGDAREKLRALIAEKFAIEEVLFQSDSHPDR